jgi:hypothetical protein
MIMEAVRTSETSMYFYQTTRRYIPEGCHLHIRRRVSLKPQPIVVCIGNPLLIFPSGPFFLYLAVFDDNGVKARF